MPCRDRSDLASRSLAQVSKISFGTAPLQGLLAVLLAIVLSYSAASPVEAWQFLPMKKTTAEMRIETIPIPASSPSGTLQEVAPPQAVQLIKEQLNNHHPEVKLKSPRDGEVLEAEDLDVVIDLKDWPIVNDPDLGLGAHLVVQMDDQTPRRFWKQDQGLVHVHFDAVRPGSHRFNAYAAYPWGEVIKSPKASLQWRNHFYQAIEGTQPRNDEPWLVSVSPSELSLRDPFLLDWMIWNAPLQNLREHDGRWRLRITINGDSFLLDRQEPIWLKGLPPGTAKVQLELLDGLGEPMNPAFNNQLRIIKANINTSKNVLPIWLQSNPSETDITKLLGKPSKRTVTKELELQTKEDIKDIEPEMSLAEKVSSSEQALDEAQIEYVPEANDLPAPDLSPDPNDPATDFSHEPNNALKTNASLEMQNPTEQDDLISIKDSEQFDLSTKNAANQNNNQQPESEGLSLNQALKSIKESSSKPLNSEH